MGTSSRIATVLDREMLVRNGAHIYPPGTPLSLMAVVTDLAIHLGERYLIRYLLPRQLGMLLTGTTDRQYVTPTPYTPEEVVSWLALPTPNQPRPYVLLLDPTGLQDVYGPRWVQMGGGIEYILAKGFLARDIVDISPDPASRPNKWELEVK